MDFKRKQAGLERASERTSKQAWKEGRARRWIVGTGGTLDSRPVDVEDP